MRLNTNERRRRQGKSVADWYEVRRGMDMPAIDRLWNSHAKTRSFATRNQLFDQYRTLALMYAATLFSRLAASVEWPEVEADALIGLMRAVESFDVGRGLLFTSYCQRRIVGSCLDGLRDRDACPRLTRSRARKWARLCDRFIVAFGRPPSADEEAVIARDFGIDANVHRAAAGAAQRVVSLDEADELREHR